RSWGRPSATRTCRRSAWSTITSRPASAIAGSSAADGASAQQHEPERRRFVAGGDEPRPVDAGPDLVAAFVPAVPIDAPRARGQRLLEDPAHAPAAGVEEIDRRIASTRQRDREARRAACRTIAE